MVLHMIWFEVQKFCIEFHVAQVIPRCTVVSVEVRDPLLLCFWCSTLPQLKANLRVIDCIGGHGQKADCNPRIDDVLLCKGIIKWLVHQLVVHRDHLAARGARHAAQMDEARLQWIFKLFPAVEKFWNHPAGKLSGGQKQMLAVSRAIVEPRDLLIIDEPSKGLAPAIIQNMIEAFQQLKASGVTILLVEQNIHFAQQLGDTVAVMDNGRVVHAGRMQALAEDTALQQSLLGLAL